MRKLISLLASRLAARRRRRRIGLRRHDSGRVEDAEQEDGHHPQGRHRQVGLGRRDASQRQGPWLQAETTRAKKGKTLSKTFKSKGTFKYVCQVHATSMKTTVKVS